MTRVKTTEEVREEFVAHVRAMVDYWRHEASKNPGLDPVSGVAHSILAAIDGCSHMPKFALVADPHPDDRDYHVKNDTNYYKDLPPIDGDISGDLRGLLYRGRR